MDRNSDTIFKEKDHNKNSKDGDDFAASCNPLSELLDSVRDVEGFPIGKDEDIFALSDPPYYTVCPNPYINDFIDKYGKPYDEATDTYERTPFVSDVSEGKNDPFYMAHSYHTKVPHKAIVRFIEHYTELGDIVFDGFCGTGMTGVGANAVGRSSVLCDLSTIATFIAYNLTSPINAKIFEKTTNTIINSAKQECGWMYETLHIDGKTKGRINFTVWSNMLICPYCGNEFILWNASVKKMKELESFNCPHCTATLKKGECARAQHHSHDQSIGKDVIQTKQAPVMISYSIGRKRFKKSPDSFDFDLINKIEGGVIPYWFPTNPIMHRGEQWGDTWRSGIHFGITNAHHFYTKRNLWVLAKVFDSISVIQDKRLKNSLLFFFTSLYSRSQKMNRYMPKHNRHVGPLSGTMYISSFPVEINVTDIAEDKIDSLTKLLEIDNNTIVSTQSLTNLSTSIKDSTVDYIFTDPPFGDNLMYSELNFIWESWLKVWTNNGKEAIINNTQNKDLLDYRELMTNCFHECYRILKPNRWITVEFHNSKASIWNTIQDSIARAGFIIAQVVVIDKQKGTTKQLSYAGTVKNDLVINAYKPKKRFEENFLKRAGEGLEKEFVEEHLNHLPVEPNIERTEQMLFSKMVAHYVKHGFEIRLNAKQFYMLLRDNFKLIEGYWFTDKQLLKYEEWKKKQGLGKIKEIKSGYEVLFINDEKSALIWTYNFLEMPRTYSDIYTAYSKATSNIEDEIPELKELLNSNFIFEDKAYRRPKTEKEQEAVEEQREKDLNKAFEQLLLEAKSSGKKLKEIRKEAITFGFTKAYQEMRFEDILTVSKKLDRKILEENSEINDFVEIAQLKLGVEI